MMSAQLAKVIHDCYIILDVTTVCYKHCTIPCATCNIDPV